MHIANEERYERQFGKNEDRSTTVSKQIVEQALIRGIEGKEESWGTRKRTRVKKGRNRVDR